MALCYKSRRVREPPLCGVGSEYGGDSTHYADLVRGRDRLRTSQFVSCHDLKGIYYIDAPPGVGKTELILSYAKKHPSRRICIVVFMVTTREMVLSRIQERLGLQCEVACCNIDKMVAEWCAEYHRSGSDRTMQSFDYYEGHAVSLGLRRRVCDSEFTIFDARAVYILSDSAIQRAWVQWVTDNYDVIYCDEAQDLSPYHAALLKAAGDEIQRLVSVENRAAAMVYAGDSDQHIFGFICSKNVLLDEHKAPGAVSLSLQGSYRLSMGIVRIVRPLATKPLFGVNRAFTVLRNDDVGTAGEGAFIFLTNNQLLASALVFFGNLYIPGYPDLESDEWPERLLERVTTREQRLALMKEGVWMSDVEKGLLKCRISAFNQLCMFGKTPGTALRTLLKSQSVSSSCPTKTTFSTIWGYKGWQSSTIRIHPSVIAMKAGPSRRMLLMVALTRAVDGIVVSGETGTEFEAVFRLMQMPHALVNYVNEYVRFAV